MRHVKETIPLALVALLALASIAVWSVVLAHEKTGELTVAFLDVGQGDALLVEAPNGNRVLIDGGATNAVLRALGSRMPFADRRIDAVIATHPDLDHIGGLPDVMDRYDVGMFIESGVSDDGADAAALADAVAREGLTPRIARQSMELKLDTDVTLTVLFPDRDAAKFESNIGSVVARLTYGDTSFLFTGDSPVSIEEHLVATFGDALKSDVLKLGHHGSRTSNGEHFLAAVQPRYAVVSAACDNTYGHPHREVLERLATAGAEVVQTCDSGTIVFSSDGHTVARVQ